MKKMSKKLLGLVLALTMLVSVFPVSVAYASEFDGGDGSPGHPYLVSNEAQLNNVRNHLDANFRLIADITLTAENWEPIGSQAAPFTGELTGAGFGIYDLKINSEAKHAGLFGYLSGGTIREVIVSGMEVTGSQFVGALLGYNGGTVADCTADWGSVTGETAGGLVGLSDGTVVECSSNVDVQGKVRAGGLVGWNRSTVSASANYGVVIGEGDYTGGITGDSFGAVRDCYNAGTVSGVKNVGGLVGFCEPMGSVEGGYNMGAVSGSEKVGGIAGCCYRSTSVSETYNVGTVSGAASVGAIIGESQANISGCYYLDGQLPGIGKVLSGADKTVALRSSAMEKKGSFPAFDFSERWIMDDCFPYPALVNVVQPVPAMDSARVYGADRYETAILAAEMYLGILGQEKFDNIVVACGTNFADALSGSYLAAQKKAPIVLVDKERVNTVKAYIQERLSANGTVYLLGGPKAVPEAMDTIAGVANIVRLQGSNRYSTNLAILEEAGVTNESLLVATGTNFADSLSAASTNMPILMVEDSLNAEQKAFLESRTGGETFILGGTAAVKERVETELRVYGPVERLAGANRYETSVMIAERFAAGAQTAVLVYGRNFPDGLSGGVLAMAVGAPLLLTATAEADAAIEYAREVGLESALILGGPGLISDKAVWKILNLHQGDGIFVLTTAN